MAESASGQGEANPVLRWATRTAKRGPCWPLGISRVGPASESSVFGHKINTFLTKLVWSRGLNIGLLRVHYPGLRLGS